MADIRAFRGYRYDLGRVGSLSDVVSPPYDVIDPALQQRLHDLVRTTATSAPRLEAVIEADKLGHAVLLPDGPSYEAVVREFGRGILNPDRTIDRERLAIGLLRLLELVLVM